MAKCQEILPYQCQVCAIKTSSAVVIQSKVPDFNCLISNCQLSALTTCAALSRSQFCFDSLQIWTQYSLRPSCIWYLKSAKSVGNFRFYYKPRVWLCAILIQNVMWWPQTLDLSEIGKWRVNFDWIGPAEHEFDSILPIQDVSSDL